MKSSIAVILLLYVFAFVEPWTVRFRCSKVLPRRCSKWLFWETQCYPKKRVYNQCSRELCSPRSPWSGWEYLAPCTKTCGPNSKRSFIRYRHCHSNQPPGCEDYGQACKSEVKVVICSTPECPGY